MAGMASKSPAAKSAIAYITIGALMLVWSGIWYVYLTRNAAEESLAYYFCAGFMLSGLTLLVVGFALGPIGRAARESELPPQEAAARNDQKDLGVAAGQRVAAANAPPLPTVQASSDNAQPVRRPAPIASTHGAPHE